MSKKLGLDSIGEMHGGQFKYAVTHALKSLVDDCNDRPLVKGKRKLTIVVELEPEMTGMDMGEKLSTITGTAQVKTSAPVIKGHSKEVFHVAEVRDAQGNPEIELLFAQGNINDHIPGEGAN